MDPVAGAEVGVVFFQLCHHAHGEGNGGADPLGPAVGVLAVPGRTRRRSSSWIASVVPSLSHLA
jgi:hypothetical protein